MSLAIQSFGEKLSFELVRDGVTIGGLAYASKIRSPKGNPAFSSAQAHIHGIDIAIDAQKTNASTGPVEFEFEKEDYEFGLLKYDWRGRCKLGLTRVDGGRDEFKIKPKGVKDFWFLIEHIIILLWNLDRQKNTAKVIMALIFGCGPGAFPSASLMSSQFISVLLRIYICPN